MFCPKCGSEAFTKNGLVNGGKQRYLCRACGRNYTQSVPRGAPLSRKLEAVAWYREGVGIRAIARRMGHSPNTIMLWIRHFGEDLEKWYDSQTLAETSTEIPILEIDEMWHWAKKNITKSGFGLLTVAPPDGSLPLKSALVVPKH
jgi:transposase-like protein